MRIYRPNVYDCRTMSKTPISLPNRAIYFVNATYKVGSILKRTAKVSEIYNLIKLCLFYVINNSEYVIRHKKIPIIYELHYIFEVIGLLWFKIIYFVNNEMT